MNENSKIVVPGIILIVVFLLGSWLVGNRPVDVNVQVETPEQNVEAQEFGGTRFPNGISADSTLPSAGEVRGTTLTLTGAATLSSTLAVAGETTVDGLTEGGGTVIITPVTTTVTLTEANLLAGNVITFTASSTQGALTVTLPATSTMTTLLASDGDTRSWMIENPFTAAATTTTIAAGTGIDLQEPDGQNVVLGINNYAWLTCFREASTDVVCRVDETIPAD